MGGQFVGGRGSNCQEADSLLVIREVIVKRRTVCCRYGEGGGQSVLIIKPGNAGYICYSFTEARCCSDYMIDTLFSFTPTKY